MLDQQIAYRSRQSAGVAQTSPLGTVARLVVRRLALGEEVAAAKYGSRQSIDDPVRERLVIQAAAGALRENATRRDIGLRFARDQIEANRVIQRGLHQRWYAHPAEVPATRRDLATQIRPDLDQVTSALMRQFTGLTDLSRLHRHVIEDLIDRQFAATMPAPPLPKLYRHAALFALRTFCLEC
jgi:chorismate mutase